LMVEMVLPQFLNHYLRCFADEPIASAQEPAPGGRSAIVLDKIRTVTGGGPPPDLCTQSRASILAPTGSESTQIAPQRCVCCWREPAIREAARNDPFWENRTFLCAARMD
jgi:hypothetical protein